MVNIDRHHYSKHDDSCLYRWFSRSVIFAALLDENSRLSNGLFCFVHQHRVYVLCHCNLHLHLHLHWLKSAKSLRDIAPTIN